MNLSIDQLQISIGNLVKARKESMDAGNLDRADYLSLCLDSYKADLALKRYVQAGRMSKAAMIEANQPGPIDDPDCGEFSNDLKE